MKVTFQAGYDGTILTRWQGKFAFPARTGPQPRAGETWEVISVTPNARETVFFLTLGTRSSAQHHSALYGTVHFDQSKQTVSLRRLKELRSYFERRRQDWAARLTAA